MRFLGRFLKDLAGEILIARRASPQGPQKRGEREEEEEEREEKKKREEKELLDTTLCVLYATFCN